MRRATATATALALALGCTAPSLPGAPVESVAPPPPASPPPPATPPLPGSAEPLPVVDRAAFGAPLAELDLSADVPLPGRSELRDAFTSAPEAGPGERERILLAVDATVDAARAFHAEQLPAAGWTVVEDELVTTGDGLRAARLTMSREDRSGIVRVAERAGQPGVLVEVVVTRP